MAKKAQAKQAAAKKGPATKAPATKAPAKKAAAKKPVAGQQVRRNGPPPPPPPSAPGEPYWLIAEINARPVRSANPSAAPVQVTVLPPDPPAVNALSGTTLSLAEFVAEARKVRFTLTLSADEAERSAQMALLQGLVEVFLQNYSAVTGVVATCQSNPSASCSNS